MVSAQYRDEDEEIVDDDTVVQLACWASQIYDKPTWYSGDISDDVWEVVNEGRAEEVTALIEAGASWSEALAGSER